MIEHTEHQAAKLEAAARTMLERHREQDAQTVEPDLQAKALQRIKRLQTDAAQLRNWLTAHPEDRKGNKGSTRKSNRTECVRLASSRAKQNKRATRTR